MTIGWIGIYNNVAYCSYEYDTLCLNKKIDGLYKQQELNVANEY